ncbi:MAG: HD domain-containing protein [Desulfobacteraceae bacterium]|nr:HD domain-containing protein [Desulfobacteraceae bacterium]
MTYLLYPGATHRRFEHSLGVMELAGRVYDVVTHENNVLPEIKESLTELSDEHARTYWRSAIRMAGLCHDLGHLPFSHMAEELLPEGLSHEHLTVQLIGTTGFPVGTGRASRRKTGWQSCSSQSS